LELILIDLDNESQLKLLKTKALRSVDSMGQYSVKETLACIDEKAIFSLEQFMVDKTAPNKPKVIGILAGLNRKTVLTDAPNTQVLIDRIMALLGRDREGRTTTSAASTDANTRIQETRFLLGPSIEHQTMMTKTFSELTLAFPRQLGCSEVLEGGQSAKDAPASLIAESVQVGKTIISCILGDTRRTVIASTTMSEVQKQKVLEFAQSVEIKIPLRLQALATTDGVHPLIEGKLQGLAGDVIFVIKDIWNDIRKAEEMVASFGNFAWNAKDSKPKTEWTKGEKRKGTESEKDQSQDPVKKTWVKREES